MILGDVMDELAARVREIAGMRAYEWPVGKIDGPAVIVSYPEAIDYDKTYGRGMDKIRGLPLHFAFPKPNDKATRDAMSRATRGTGPTSVKEALERGRYTSCGDVTVTGCTFDVVTIGGADYMAATFLVDVTGGGN